MCKQKPGEKTLWDSLSTYPPIFILKNVKLMEKLGRIVQQTPICQDLPIVNVYTFSLSLIFTDMNNTQVYVYICVYVRIGVHTYKHSLSQNYLRVSCKSCDSKSQKYFGIYPLMKYPTSRQYNHHTQKI